MPSSPATIDLDRLLAPITPENPCGEYLKYENCYTELSDYRKARKDPLDPSKDKVPEWGKLFARSSEILGTLSKDLMLAGWLTESSARINGFAGLRDGLRLVHGLVEKYWDKVHPMPDGADYSTRAAPLYWLASDDSGPRLPVVLRDIRLIESSTDVVLNWKYWHLRRPEPRGKEEKEDPYNRRVAEAEKAKQVFDTAEAATPVQYFQDLNADLNECLQIIEKLGIALDERLKEDAPNWSALRKIVGDIQVFVLDVLKRRGVSTSSSPVTELPIEDVESTPGRQAGGSEKGGPIRSRADAVARLEEVAQYLSSAEPHSPVAYLVRRAIRWAGMPFADVLNELVKDDKLVKQIGETLGIVPDAAKH